MKHNFRYILFFSLSILSITTISARDKIVLKGSNIQIVQSKSESEPVKRAVNDLIRDFGKTLGATPELLQAVNPKKKNVQIIVVNEETSNDLNVDKQKLKSLDGFESHRIYSDTKENKIYLCGKDMRGTIFAIYSFSEQVLGVPPLWYFSSWVPEKKKMIELPENFDYFEKSPQVKYRSWFPNDKDLYTPWEEISEKNVNSVLEALLRLKLNCIELETTVSNSQAYEMSNYSKKVNIDFGIIITSHHHTPLNNSLRNWGEYWKNIKKQPAPKLLLANEKDLVDFWRYNITTAHKSKMENLWLLGFRGDDDKPFWINFADAPESEIERAEVINKMHNIQYNLIKEITNESQPYVRLTFYDELSDLLAAGYLKPPVGENVIWTYVAGRRDHYPYDDLVQFNPASKVKMGYYMNLQFTSTGSHLVQAEGPWKMEYNYRYVNSKSPLFFSVINVGNIREHLFSMTANAQMMWNMDTYNTDKFVADFSKKYFGEEHANEVAALYKEFFYSYWEQKKPDFQNMERQYIFQDLRHARVINQITSDFFNYKQNPLVDIGFERVKGRTFRLENNENQVDEILNGMKKTIPKFEAVASKCSILKPKLPITKQQFFYDNLCAQAEFMANISNCLYHFVFAYKHQQDLLVCKENLEQSVDYMKKAKAALYGTHHGVFSDWYAGDQNNGKFGMDKIIRDINKLIEELKMK